MIFHNSLTQKHYSKFFLWVDRASTWRDFLFKKLCFWVARIQVAIKVVLHSDLLSSIFLEPVRNKGGLRKMKSQSNLCLNFQTRNCQEKTHCFGFLCVFILNNRKDKIACFQKLRSSEHRPEIIFVRSTHGFWICETFWCPWWLCDGQKPIYIFHILRQLSRRNVI